MSGHSREFMMVICQCVMGILDDIDVTQRRLPRPFHGRYKVYFEHFLWTVGLATRVTVDRKKIREPRQPQGSLPEMIDAGLLTQSSRGNTTGIYEPLRPKDISIKGRFEFYDAKYFADNLFPAILSYLTHFGLGEVLPTKRLKTFIPGDPLLNKLMVALVDEHYATKTGDGYQWLDSIARTMARAQLWGPDDIKPRAHDLLEADIQKLFNGSEAIPFHISSDLASHTPWGLSIAITSYWDGDVWHKEVLKPAFFELEQSVALSEAFCQKYIYDGRDWRERAPKPLNADEKDFMRALAKGIHYLYLEKANEGSPNPENEIHNLGQRALYDGLDFLWQSGLCLAFHPDLPAPISYVDYKAQYENAQRFSFMTFTFHAILFDHIDEAIRFEAFEDKTGFTPDPLSCFFDIAEYLDALPLGRWDEFTLSEPPLIAALEAFCRQGYARKTDICYDWSDKIAPFMLENYGWRIDDADMKFVDWDIVRITIPKLAATERSFSLPELLQYWDGEHWQDSPLEDPALGFDNAAAIIRVMAGEIELP